MEETVAVAHKAHLALVQLVGGAAVALSFGLALELG
jgi:hypothetical protein